MGAQFAGKVVAMIGRGAAGNRAVAVALAEAGADIAIATFSPSQDEEFATASIANEVWAIGREQFSQVMDASDAAAVERFASRVKAELGDCSALLVIGDGAVETAAFPSATVAWIPEGDPDDMVAEARQLIG